LEEKAQLERLKWQDGPHHFTPKLHQFGW